MTHEQLIAEAQALVRNLDHIAVDILSVQKRYGSHPVIAEALERQQQVRAAVLDNLRTMLAHRVRH